MNGGNIRQALSMRAYCRRVEGVGESHRERSLQKVKCDLCGAEVNRQHLKVHQTRRACNTGQKDYQATLQNHVAELSSDPPESIEVEEPESQYLVSMDGVTKTTCPVANCPFGAVIPGKMRKHFRARHMRDTIIVEEEGHLPRCVGCGLFQRSVGIKHQQTADCIRWTKIREDREADKVNKETVAGTVFHVQGVPIETVSEFKYLGRVVKNNDDDWPAVNQNLKKATATWGRICKILSKEGAKTQRQWNQYTKLSCRPCFFMVPNHGYFPFRWKRNWKVSIGNALGTSQANTLDRIGMSRGLVRQAKLSFQWPVYGQSKSMFNAGAPR